MLDEQRRPAAPAPELRRRHLRTVVVRPLILGQRRRLAPKAMQTPAGHTGDAVFAHAGFSSPARALQDLAYPSERRGWYWCKSRCRSLEEEHGLVGLWSWTPMSDDPLRDNGFTRPNTNSVLWPIVASYPSRHQGGSACFSGRPTRAPGSGLGA
uniref:Uncharacterized protein n=1 Tax=Mycena chlorophos TaxID=658473 RepID=A0ABQ0KX60_MYCCL|nr:predicted protein [Mycena chlorophos]